MVAKSTLVVSPSVALIASTITILNTLVDLLSLDNAKCLLKTLIDFISLVQAQVA